MAPLLTSLAFLLLLGLSRGHLANQGGDFRFDDDEVSEQAILASYEDGTPIPGLAEARLNASGSLQNAYIVNGENAVKGAQPYMASVQFVKDGRAYHTCGGFLTSSPHKVITAAHCLRQWGQHPFKVALGYYQLSLGTSNPGSQLIEVASAVKMPGYQRGNRGAPDDVAVLTLVKPATVTDTVKPGSMSSALPPALYGQEVTTTGWGLTDQRSKKGADILQFAKLTVITQEQCKKAVGSPDVLPEHVCAVNPPTGTCQADSGGPAVHNGLIVGVTSFGDQRCGRASVFNNLASHKAWLKSQPGGENFF